MLIQQFKEQNWKSWYQLSFYQVLQIIHIPTFRKSPSAKFCIKLAPKEKKPRPSGLYGTIPIPRSLKPTRQTERNSIILIFLSQPKIFEGKKFTHLHVGTISSSKSLDHKDHSFWTAVNGWTAWALLIVEAEASDRPTYFIFPSSTSFFSSPILKSMPQTSGITHTKSIKWGSSKSQY